MRDDTMSRRRVLRGIGAGTAATMIAGCSGQTSGGGGDGGGGGETTQTTSGGNGGKKVVNVLTWPGYDKIAEMTKEETGATVNLKNHTSNVEAFNQMKAGGVETFDVLTTDGFWVQRNAEAGHLLKHKKEWFPTVDDWAEQFSWGNNIQFQHEGDSYGVPARWGYLGIGYDKREVNKEEVQSYDFLWTGGPNGKFENNITTYDFPSQNIPIIANALGYDPYDQTDEELQDIKDKVIKMMENAVAIHSGASGLRDDLLQGNAIAAFGVGNWSLSDLIQDGNEWVVGHLPTETKGMYWIGSASVVKNPQYKEGAITFLNSILSPDGQRAICWDAPTHGVPCNAGAHDNFDDREAKILMTYKGQGFDATQEVIDRTFPLRVPPDDMLDKWTDLWEEAKARAGL